jgi:hypothetical protein
MFQFDGYKLFGMAFSILGDTNSYAIFTPGVPLERLLLEETTTTQVGSPHGATASPDSFPFLVTIALDEA